MTPNREAKQPGYSFLSMVRRGPWTIYAILAGFILFNILFNPYFATSYNISNIIQQSTSVMLVSIGQAFVIIGGGLDFSVGGVVSLTTCVIATLMTPEPGSIFIIIALVFLVGGLVGLINGIGVAFFRINPFIMTMGTMGIGQGVSFLFREYAGGKVPQNYIKALTGNIGFIPTPLLMMVGAMVVGMILFKKTRFGRYVYATGGNAESAKASGINVKAVQIAIFVVSGLFATVSGLFMAARISSGDPRIGESLPLDSVTAVVLGGVIIGGGRGSLAGVIAGVFLIVILSNVLTLFDVSPYYHYIVKGVLLGLAVAVTFRKEKREYI